MVNIETRRNNLLLFISIKKKKQEYTKGGGKCKTLLNRHAMLHFSYHVLVSGDQLLPEETEDGSSMYQSFETV